MRIIFIGTPAFAVPSLRRLAAGDMGLTAVITQPDRPAGRGQHPRPSPIKLAAQDLGIPILEPGSLQDPEVVAQLTALAPEVIITVAYGQILRPELLDIPANGVLNMHPSLLPRWRGASPIPAAILAGDEQTGVTIMLMDAGMDSGPILAQHPITIEPADNADTITEQLSHMGADLLAETLPRWLAGEIRPAAQDETLATKSALLRKEDGAIDWSIPAIDIWRRVRAYNPWPGAYTSLDNDLIHIWQAWPLEIDSGRDPGTIVTLESSQISEVQAVNSGAFAVTTGKGSLAILRLQRAGRRAMHAEEFLRGMPGLIGRLLRTGPPRSAAD